MSDYFSEDELIKKTGIVKSSWDFVILKELIDNALDAIEPLSHKKISIDYTMLDKRLNIFDNGSGISIDTIKKIYDFSMYVSRNRHFVTPSRGKQGNGLKTIISICYILGYKLYWHTFDRIIVEMAIDTSKIESGLFPCEMIEHGETDHRGIEIIGYNGYGINQLQSVIKRYAQCNRDVNFTLSSGQYILDKVLATANPIDRSKDISIAFYDYHTFLRLIQDTQDGETTYKSFLGDIFGTRIKNQSIIKSKIKDINFNGTEFQEDFMNLKSYQKNKQYTLLKNHMMGLKYSFNTEMMIQNKQNASVCNSYVPCIVEFDVVKTDIRSEKGYLANCDCYINNTITYNNAESIVFDGDFYSLGWKKCPYAGDLSRLLMNYNDYQFTFHFISPYFLFRDAGKTEIDITCIIGDFIKALSKALGKEKRIFDAKIEKPTDTRTLMRNSLDEAFMLASTNGKYAITARQIWYKMRELSGIKETNSTYRDFTQEILTDWINEHPQYESKVNFSDRGNFYIGKEQNGLGTANVRHFIDNIDSKSNSFQCYGGISSDVFIEDEFNIEYKYDKVLYIEKTGFDAIFKAENIGEKYHMVIVSGQGFSTRAAKTLLYTLQKRGLKLYCMHDLDISGVQICETLRVPNDKFQYPIEIEDLGIGIDDVKKYDIKPEEVDKKSSDTDKLANMADEYRKFFDGGKYYRRVELNACTTEQILEILEHKLSTINNLPKINLADTLDIDHSSLREAAFLRLIEKKYKEQLKEIYIPCDLSEYEGKYTVENAKKAIPEIKDRLITEYEKEIERKLNILQHTA